MPAKWKDSSAPTPNLLRLQQQAYQSFEQGDLDKTQMYCAEILERQPGDFDALHLLGVLNFHRQRMSEAIHFFGEALKVDSTSADALSNLGLVFQASGRHEEAVASYRDALRFSPGHPEILYNLANACLELGRVDDALAGYDEVLAVAPRHAGALVNRGNTLLRFNRPADALSNYDAALAIMPAHAQILTNRGHALRRLDRPIEALEDLKAAMTAAPDFAEAHFEAGMTQLTLGDFESGWKEYEWRWKASAFARHRRPSQVTSQARLWLGDRPVAGKTILLQAEQGFGDTLQFIRYAPLLVAQGAKVICEVQPELLPLLSRLDGVTVIAIGAPLPVVDFYCPLLSLPLAFGTRLDSIPSATAYLVAPAVRVAYWQDRLPQMRPRAGFVWSGQSSHKNDSNRSIPLARLAPLLRNTPVACVSLQSELRPADRDIMDGLPDLMHLGDDLRDFADTAAVVSLLDVVVTVDTATAHLAGALGKQVIILLPHAADFRWMRDRDDTPWYPSAKLFRQPAFGDWDSVIIRLGYELEQLRSPS